ncbi:MAG: bifunctional methionine sulfoxide reductase B/A protein [bacterium]
MSEETGVEYNELTPAEKRVILEKGTEVPYTGAYHDHWEEGTYICKRCDAPLYRSKDKFDARCGWPSFDDEIEGAVTRTTDADGIRTEITCTNCGAHLGHVFLGEEFTPTDTRHCVNSLAMDFVPEGTPLPSGPMASAAARRDQPQTEKAYLAGGCFWGVEHFLEQLEGVESVRSGYMGGHVPDPSYEEVCTGRTGHAETVEVLFDPGEVSFETIARTFFEIHDPTQLDRQGPDHGSQYRSAVFYTSPEQEAVVERLIGILEENGYDVVTEVEEADTFWPAEQYHQDYYEETGGRPYCHGYVKRFP